MNNMRAYQKRGNNINAVCVRVDRNLYGTVLPQGTYLRISDHYMLRFPQAGWKPIHRITMIELNPIATQIMSATT